MEEFNFKNAGKADLHIHSRYSKDSISSLKAILTRAKKTKLDLIAITDHDTIEGAKEAIKMASEFGVNVIIGEEIKTKMGDIVALFIEETILSGRGLVETVKEIHQQNGLAIIPHPGNWFADGVSYESIFEIFDQLDGIELFNGAWPGGNKREETKTLNKLFFNLAGVGGSDAHLARQVGSAYTIFPGRSPKELYASIKNKTTMPMGNSWGYKGYFFWLVNSPRIFWRSPQTFTNGVKKIIKKII